MVTHIQVMTNTPIQKFWKMMLGIEIDSLEQVNYSEAGRYIDKFGDQYIYLLEDLTSGKKVFAGKGIHLLRPLKSKIENHNSKSIRQIEPFSRWKLVFKDIDYLLQSSPPVTPKKSLSANYAIKELTSTDQSSIDEFFTDCSDNDRDTLDLEFSGETAIGLFNGRKLSGITRYLPVRDTGVADITVVVRQSERGKGLSTSLVSHAVHHILSKGLIPKYRVDEDLLASRKIAENLGMVARYQLLTWEKISV